MISDPLCGHEILQTWMSDHDFALLSHQKTGGIFCRSRDHTCLIIDTNICELPNYPYVAYTSNQNELMATYDRVFRFFLNKHASFDEVLDEIELFLSGESDPEIIRRFGGNRAEQEPDPTIPEAVFEDCFLEAFGDRARMGLHREFTYVDLAGVTRYIDYALFCKTIKFAIELNGESFHHPVVTGPKRYRSQLFKQNSLVADGFRVFRWSLRGMNDRERFILELKKYMGGSRPFLDKQLVRVSREVFTLRKHQREALKALDKARKNGRYSFLLVLPTGTGKTEIFIEDLVRLKRQSSTLRSLIIVPTRKLREQTIARLKLRLPARFQDSVSTDILGENRVDFFVQTAAYLHRHYYKIPASCFDYIVVDEAHHAPAQGLRAILEHFTPTHLLGVTATPERFDQQRLEKIFGEYEAQLSLEDAILEGLVPPVRCYRVESNIDLSEVRFNGKEYVKNDLQRTLLVPSRDQLVADVLRRYFSGTFSSKQGVIFCVDIQHARRMAALLNETGLRAAYVDGRDRNNAKDAQSRYDSGTIRFLCACDLLTEGWDAPQTEILVMARPTFSKVLYSQQLGRGLRNYKGKEALYVIDVVDNYGARLQPLSLHALFQIARYQPFTDLITPKVNGSTDEITVLAGLYEGERRVEPVNIFSFEEKYGSYLNEEQLARELFVSTGTVKKWLKEGQISADLQYPFGRKNLHFFDPGKVEAIRKKQGLKKHTAATRVEDFIEFLEKRDYTFSYKIVFLLAFLKVSNERFEASLPEILNSYNSFYLNLLAKHGKSEREKSPYNRQEYLEDENSIQRSILANPFEKFERKRFFYHCKDLKYLAMDPELFQGLTREQFQQINEQLRADLKDYYEKLEVTLTVQDYSFLLPTGEEDGTTQNIFVEKPADDEKFTTVLPFYPLSIAAGDFMESAVPREPDTWFTVDGLTRRSRLSKSMFVAQVMGKSMEPVIPDGAFCLFTLEVGGSRNGRIVLAQKDDLADPDTGASYTVKKYQSTKKEDSDTGWQHETITLKPANSQYDDIVIPVEDVDDFRIVAFFEEVLATEFRG